MSGRLRVVGGSLAGRRFASHVAKTTRPTSDRVREAIASAVASRGGFEGTVVLDLFAGTGAMAIEALSRGAERAVLVERDRGASRGIDESLRSLALSDRARVLGLDLAGAPAGLARKLAESGPFDRVLIDPPYAEVTLVPPLIDALADAGALADDALVVLEHPSGAVPALGRGFEVVATKRYGDSAVLFARYARPRPEPIPSEAPSDEGSPR